jgi:hypothetical protein
MRGCHCVYKGALAEAPHPAGGSPALLCLLSAVHRAALRPACQPGAAVWPVQADAAEAEKKEKEAAAAGQAAPAAEGAEQPAAAAEAAAEAEAAAAAEAQQPAEAAAPSAAEGAPARSVPQVLATRCSCCHAIRARGAKIAVGSHCVSLARPRAPALHRGRGRRQTAACSLRQQAPHRPPLPAPARVPAGEQPVEEKAKEEGEEEAAAAAAAAAAEEAQPKSLQKAQAAAAERAAGETLEGSSTVRGPCGAD